MPLDTFIYLVVPFKHNYSATTNLYLKSFHLRDNGFNVLVHVDIHCHVPMVAAEDAYVFDLLL